MSIFYSKLVRYGTAMGFSIFILNLLAHFLNFFEHYTYFYILIFESLFLIIISYFFLKQYYLESYKQSIKVVIRLSLLVSISSFIFCYVYLLVDDSMLNEIFFKFLEILRHLELSDQQLQRIMNYGLKLVKPFYFSLIFKGLAPFLLNVMFSFVIFGILILKLKRQ